MGLALEEQETTINCYRTSDMAEVFTSDRTVMTKLDKLVESSEHWTLKEECKLHGEVVGKKYCCPKKFISFRSKIQTRELTEKERQKLGERMKNMKAEKS